MKDYVAETFWIGGDGAWFCRICGSLTDDDPAKDYTPDAHSHYQGNCYVAAFQAALAAMEGTDEDNSPPRDEISDEYRERVVEDNHHGAMLVDKLYERDDIYKK